jgi:hypothetical protein
MYAWPRHRSRTVSAHPVVSGGGKEKCCGRQSTVPVGFEERPNFAKRRPPRRANTAQRDLAPHRGQLAGVNSLHVDRNGHFSILDQDRDRLSVEMLPDDALAFPTLGDFGRITQTLDCSSSSGRESVRWSVLRTAISNQRHGDFPLMWIATGVSGRLQSDVCLCG